METDLTTHWYENLRTGQRFEFKTQITDGARDGSGDLACSTAVVPCSSGAQRLA